MMSLVKGAEPQWLIDNAAAKTREFIEAPANKKPSPWRNPEVLAALTSEASRKCIYCEQVADDTGYSAVDHLKPKKHFPQDVLDWDNLGLACTRCNTNKGEYWTASPDLCLLNPFLDPISAHLDFCGPMVVAKPGSTRGKNTLRQLKFTERTDLLISRARAIQLFDDILRLWSDETDAAKKQLFSEDVETACARGQEHTGVLRAYAEFFGFVHSKSTE